MPRRPPAPKDTWLMLTTLDAIVRRLADAYEPDRVILFGSRARGPAPHDADFDRAFGLTWEDCEAFL